MGFLEAAMATKGAAMSTRGGGRGVRCFALKPCTPSPSHSQTSATLHRRQRRHASSLQRKHLNTSAGLEVTRSLRRTEVVVRSSSSSSSSSSSQENAAGGAASINLDNYTEMVNNVKV